MSLTYERSVKWGSRRVAMANWFSASKAACLSAYKAAARAACISAWGENVELDKSEFSFCSMIMECKNSMNIPGYPFRDIETSSISAIASSLSPTSYRANALPTLAYSENAKSL